MPGWYIHMEAARLAADRLRSGQVPGAYGLDPAEAQRLGDLAYKWRNYLALGALGPDLFYLLPDFKAPHGGPLLSVADWIFGVWTTVEDHILGPWDKWMGPVGANDSAIAAQLTGGLSKQIGQAVDLLSGAVTNAILTLPTRAVDIFGQLTSGPPQGFAESAFYWSDMLHYRRTYDVPRVLFERGRQRELNATDDDERANGEAAQAFAIGWASHCATDVVGHAFTNAKSGGPFRLHWQRHHLVENHFDSRAYADRYGTGTHYRTIGSSGLHFRIAWRVRADAPYNGRADAPAYDYFAGLPAYDVDSDPASEHARRQHFSMSPEQLPEHLVTLLTETFKQVYADTAPDITPEVLNTAAPAYSDDGRPNADALQVMWQIAFRYLAHLSTSGLSLEPPSPPALINDHSFPTPPGGTSASDPDRGVDLSDDDVTFLDILLAIIAWVLFIGQVVIWLVTILPGLIIDVVTFPARAILHYAVVSPLYSLYMASRRLLVMTGFITPDTREIDPGLVMLGRSSTFFRGALRGDLADPTGFAPLPAGFDEPTGRPDPADARHADPAYPRDTPRDPVPVLAQLLLAAGAPPVIPSNGTLDPYSEWVAPWRYPERDIQGFRIGWEADLVHAGPYLVGDAAPVLLDDSATDVAVAAEYEAATGPDQTEEITATYLPDGRHLGSPVDYTLYLVSRLSNGQPVRSFNLDSDRAYAWQCWDWTRHVPAADPADPAGLQQLWRCWPAGTPEFEMQQPCTPPAQFDPYGVEHQPAPPTAPLPEHSFDPTDRRLVHYLDPQAASSECGNVVVGEDIRQSDRDRVGDLPPEGQG
ncbi:zinc dependent phospholipase C family protein [Geodermatophilus sp. SYSU D00867]